MSHVNDLLMDWFLLRKKLIHNQSIRRSLTRESSSQIIFTLLSTSVIGKVKESVSAPNTPDATDGIHHFANVVDFAMQRSYMKQSKKRENAAKLLWKTGLRRLSARVGLKFLTFFVR